MGLAVAGVWFAMRIRDQQWPGQKMSDDSQPESSQAPRSSKAKRLSAKTLRVVEGTAELPSAGSSAALEAVLPESRTDFRGLPGSVTFENHLPHTGGKESAAAPEMTVLGSVPTFHSGWRVGRAGLILKRESNGTWMKVASGVESNLFDISFSSPSVGWAVGQGGTVLRTTDRGTSWIKVSTPTQEDLARVGAVSEQAALVITFKGQTLTTADGGISWRVVANQ